MLIFEHRVAEVILAQVRDDKCHCIKISFNLFLNSALAVTHSWLLNNICRKTSLLNQHCFLLQPSVKCLTH